jgi:predicted DCC family thiol-disulfide oxidoreductase YuxK
MPAKGTGGRAAPAPALIYDADCGFCRGWIERWRSSTGERVRYVPSRRPGLWWRYGVRRRSACAAAQLVTPRGRRYRGAPAMLRALLRARSPWVRAAARLGLLPGVRRVAEAAYRSIATHRMAVSRVQRAAQRVLGLAGPRAPQHPFWAALSRPGLPVRGLGAVYVAAFASLRTQIRGLYGERGILPAAEQLEARAPLVTPGSRWRRFADVPSLLWLDPSDRGLERLCVLGEAAGAAMVLGLAPRLAAVVAWGAYLSLVTVGRDFLRFQWDVLLLEAGLQATLGRPRRLLMRTLAFRLQLESGVAKLASHDPTWRDLSACCHHQETQPLPTPVGWYAHHLPRPVQKFATLLTLAVECAAPFLVFGPRRWRRIAFLTLTGFQALIAVTGNYAFFNWLTAVLNLAVVERPAPRPAVPRRGRYLRALASAVDGLAAGALLALGASDLRDRLRRRAPRRSDRLDRLESAVAPFHAVGSYGLFSVMTTQRPEVVIEGSADGAAWREYSLRHKPGDVMRAPRWTAPHQPRLDWQMWFAALGYPPPWFARLMARLLEGAPEVVALFESNPFPERPPRYVRAWLYDYKAADLDTHRRTGAWWVRTKVGSYFPACTLGRGGDVRVRP